MTSENIQRNAHAELAKAYASLRAARALARLDLCDDAASRLYYAAFHLISAALVCLGVQAQAHKGVAALLGQHLVHPGHLPPRVSRDFAVLIGLRAQADYNRHFQLDRQSLEEEMQRTDALFALVESFLGSHGISLPSDEPRSA